MDKEEVLKQIIDSNMSSDVKVYLVGLVSSKSEDKVSSPINEEVLNPTGWGRKGKELYESQLEWAGH